MGDRGDSNILRAKTIHHQSTVRLVNMNTTEQLRQLWTNLGLSEAALEGGSLLSRSPIDDRALAQVHVTSPSRADELLARSADAFRRWRKVPAPQRGELVLTSQGLKFAVRRVI
jgi:hypothetical protein